jgi:hypothetical protein
MSPGRRGVRRRGPRRPRRGGPRRRRERAGLPVPHRDRLAGRADRLGQVLGVSGREREPPVTVPAQVDLQGRTAAADPAQLRGTGPPQARAPGPHGRPGGPDADPDDLADRHLVRPRGAPAERERVPPGQPDPQLAIGQAYVDHGSDPSRRTRPPRRPRTNHSILVDFAGSGRVRPGMAGPAGRSPGRSGGSGGGGGSRLRAGAAGPHPGPDLSKGEFSPGMRRVGVTVEQLFA